MKCIPNLTIILLISIAATVTAVDLSGTLKPEFSITDQPLPDSAYRYILQVPLRLMLGHNTGALSIDLAWSPVPNIGNPALSGKSESSDSHIFRFTDIRDRLLPSEWSGDEKFSILQNLDRLNIGLRTDIATLTLGRQAIYWGVAKSVSPTDFIAPVQYGTVNTEYRTGVDAFKSVFPVGMMSEIEAGYVFGEDGSFSESGSWLRGRFYLLQTDATLLAACFRENLMIGGSLNRTIGQGTGWLELAVVSTNCFSAVKGAVEVTFWSFSTGYDRSWLNASLYGYLEYHFNSPGTDDPGEYSQLVTEPAWTKGGIYLLGRHYLCPGLSWSINPLLQINASALANLTDPSAYIYLSGEYSVLEDITLNLNCSMKMGKEAGQDGIPESEFGSWPDEFSISAGYYF